MSSNEFQRTIVMMILLSRVIHSRRDFLPISTDRAAVAPTGPIDDVSASGRRASGDLVEGRVRHLIRLHPRRALDHLLQRLEDGGIRATRIRLCVFFQIPHADANCVCSAGVTNAISSWKPFCFRSAGMMSLSRIWVNAA